MMSSYIRPLPKSIPSLQLAKPGGSGTATSAAANKPAGATAGGGASASAPSTRTVMASASHFAAAAPATPKKYFPAAAAAGAGGSGGGDLSKKYNMCLILPTTGYEFDHKTQSVAEHVVRMHARAEGEP